MGIVSVLCPYCFKEHLIENDDALIVCNDCGQIIPYKSFEIPAYIEEDECETPSESQMKLGGCCIELIKGFSLKILNGHTEKVIEGPIEAACLDSEFAYYLSPSGIYQAPLWGDGEPEKLSEPFPIKAFKAYLGYFVFLGGEELSNAIWIMPKNGSWIRKVCPSKKLLVYGNWAYSMSKSLQEREFQVYRVSLDGMQKAVMCDDLPHIIEESLRVDRSGVCYGDIYSYTNRLDLLGTYTNLWNDPEPGGPLGG